MKRNCLVLIFSFMLLLTVNALGALTGDVTVKINGHLPGGSDPAGWVIPGAPVTLEFWLTNSAKIKGMSLGYELTNDGFPFSFQTGYGNLPNGAGDPDNVLNEEGVYVGSPTWGADFLNSFGAGGLAITMDLLPDTVFYGGADATSQQRVNILPHATSKIAYTMKLVATGDPGGHFCIRPIYVPPAGAWKMDGGSVEGACAPSFNGTPVESSANPNIPPVCFTRDLPPCQAPQFTNTPAAAVNQNHCSAYTFDFDAVDHPQNDPPALPLTFSTSVGTINPSTGQLSVPAVAQCGTTNVVVTVTNTCVPPKSAEYPFTINWTNNNPSITNCAALNGAVGKGNTFTRTVTFTDPDPCDASVLSVVCTDAIPPIGAFDVVGNLFTFVSDINDVGVHNFLMTVTDPCGGTGTCAFAVDVLATEPFGIQIEKVHDQLQGHYAYVSITQEKGSNVMGGFDFLIAYDASALSFVSAQLGAAPVANNWEYFTYRFGAQGNCDGPCPSGMLRVVAIADQNNGPAHPTLVNFPAGSELVQLKFYVSNDRTYNCMFVPIRFVWLDCGDNAISNIGGDTLWIEKSVWDYYGIDGEDSYVDITNYDCEELTAFHYGGYCDPGCLQHGLKTVPVPFIDFYNGGVDIICSDSIDARGDLNLNGIANEIADAVLYTNYFLKGIIAFPALGREGAIAASDVNADGRTLTVGDLVYLLRIIVGDALPYPKLAPFASGATVNFANGSVSTESASEIGAVYATFTVNGAYTVASNTDMQVESAEVNGELKVLVYSGLSNLSNRLTAGSNNLFTVNGDVELKSVEVADYNGNMLNTRVNKTSLPKAFALSQNVPNPFNPTTKIGFALPNQSEWTLSIYNVAGQLVKNFSGNSVGNVTVEWDATMVPSGVYFYKLNAGSFSDTKKMVLMK